MSLIVVLALLILFFLLLEGFLVRVGRWRMVARRTGQKLRRFAHSGRGSRAG